jgi:hypothetical protein
MRGLRHDRYELQLQLATATPPLLLHVLPEEVFISQRIPGSQNACVYGMAFAGRRQEGGAGSKN